MERGMNGNGKTIHNYSEYFTATLGRSFQHSEPTADTDTYPETKENI